MVERDLEHARERFTLRSDLPLTLDVKQAARLLGIGQNGAYEAIRRGDIPALRIGRRLVVPTQALLGLLGSALEVHVPGNPLGPSAGARPKRGE